MLLFILIERDFIVIYSRFILVISMKIYEGNCVYKQLFYKKHLYCLCLFTQ